MRLAALISTHSRDLLSGTSEFSQNAPGSALGHSDMETSRAVCIHVVPDSQKRAVERGLFSNVRNSDSGELPSGRLN
jgi:hypothetical protein